MGELYRISFPNGKEYIGITSQTAKKRFAGHLSSLKRGEKVPLYHALRKYGVEAVTVETLAREDDWANLCQMERDAIAKHGTRSPAGYNATDGGDGAPKGHRYRVGLKHSDAARAKMSASRMGSTHTAETRAKIGAASRGNKHAFGRKPSAATEVKRFRSLITGPANEGSFSGVKGVSWCRCTNKWRAHLTIGGKMRTLGRFNDVADAANARAAAVIEVLSRGAFHGG